jgi:hypothetical protein
VVGLRSAVAIAIAGSGIGLAVGTANAETAAPAELEAQDAADSGARDARPTAQTAEQRQEERERQNQQRAEWWAHAREVLFDDIELSEEQAGEVDAIIEAQLEDARRSGELRAELAAARKRGDAQRIRAIRAENREVRVRRKGPHESIEKMRALLSEEQHPIFDLNRARLAAEGQEPQQRRRQRRPRADAEVETE